MNDPIYATILALIDQDIATPYLGKKPTSYGQVLSKPDPLFAHELNIRDVRCHHIDGYSTPEYVPTDIVVDINSVNMPGVKGIGTFDIVHFTCPGFLEFPFIVSLACRRLLPSTGGFLVVSSTNQPGVPSPGLTVRHATYEPAGLLFLAGEGEVIKSLHWSVFPGSYKVNMVIVHVKNPEDQTRWRIVDQLKKLIYS